MATISKVAIGNMALSHIGADSTIEDFDENSAEADQIDIWYDFARIQTLEAFDWTFARTRLVLATHSEDPPEGIWAYRYQYPADALKIREIENPAGKGADAIPYEIELDATKSTKTVITNLDDAVAIYTFDNETTALFSSHFVMTLSRLLASLIAVSLTSKQSLMESNFSVWGKLIKDASNVDANEEALPPPREAESIRAR